MSLLKKITGTVAGFGMKALGEERYEFLPKYVPGWGDHDPLLKPPEAYGLEGFEEFALHLDSGERVTAWYKPAKEGCATIAYCHGNAGSLDMRRNQLKALDDLGFGVLIAAYPGFKHGVESNAGDDLRGYDEDDIREMDAGAAGNGVGKEEKGAAGNGFEHSSLISPSERGCISTGHAMVRELTIGRGVPLEDIVLLGASLGGAVALRTEYDLEQPHNFLGREPMQVGAVITLNTFESLVKRAIESFPDMPLNAIMDNRFESHKVINDIKAPVLLLHGEQDTFTPPAHSVRLAEAAGGKARLVVLPGINHALTRPGTEDEFDHEQLARVTNEAQQFLYEHGLYPEPVPVAVREMTGTKRVTTVAD